MNLTTSHVLPKKHKMYRYWYVWYWYLRLREGEVKCCKCVHVLQNLYWYKGCININKYFLLDSYSKNMFTSIIHVYFCSVSQWLAIPYAYTGTFLFWYFKYYISNVIAGLQCSCSCECTWCLGQMYMKWWNQFINIKNSVFYHMALCSSIENIFRMCVPHLTAKKDIKFKTLCQLVTYQIKPTWFGHYGTSGQLVEQIEMADQFGSQSGHWLHSSLSWLLIMLEDCLSVLIPY